MDFLKDSNDKDIHIEDIVSVLGDNNSVPNDTECEVITIFDNTIQCNPINAGVAFMILPSLVTVKYSFISDLKYLAKNRKLKEVLVNAEQRQVVKVKGVKKSTTEVLQQVIGSIE